MSEDSQAAMRFFGYFRSSAAYRCRIAFNLKGVTPAFEPVHLRKGEQQAPVYRAINPQGLVPALQVGAHVLTQSLAIVEWLDETYPAPPLLPRDAFARAHVRSLALSIACDVHPLQNLRVLGHLKDACGQDRAGLDRWCRHWISDGLGAFEERLLQIGCARGFCFGDAPTLADICLIPQLFSADRFGVDLTGLPHLQRIRAHCDRHPAFARAHPDTQSDAAAPPT